MLKRVILGFASLAALYILAALFIGGLPGTATYYSESFIPRPSEFGVGDLTLTYRAKPTSTEFDIPFIYRRSRNHGPYHFSFEAWTKDRSELTNRIEFTIHQVSITTTNSILTDLDQEIVIQLKPDIFWNQHYSEKYGIYRRKAECVLPNPIPVDWDSADFFYAEIKLSISSNMGTTNITHTMLFQKTSSRQESSYWKYIEGM